MIQPISMQSQLSSSKKSSIKPYITGMSIAMGIGALHGVAIEVNGGGRLASLRKVLYPLDHKMFNLIEKFPKGNKLTSYLMESKGKVRPLFANFHYDLPLVAKGAAFMGVLCLAAQGLYKGIKTLINKDK